MRRWTKRPKILPKQRLATCCSCNAPTRGRRVSFLFTLLFLPYRHSFWFTDSVGCHADMRSKLEVAEGSIRQEVEERDMLHVVMGRAARELQVDLPSGIAATQQVGRLMEAGRA